MRLIDAEALTEKIKEQINVLERDLLLDKGSWLSNIRLVWFKKLLIIIEKAPTIETKPVVHAHWKNIFCLITPYDDDDYEEARCKCSNCTMITDFEYDYCPYCGAQMDEVVEDG